MDVIYDYVVTCKGLRSQIRKVDVIGDYGSRKHEAVRFWGKLPDEPQEVRILKIPKPLPDVSGEKIPSISDSVQGGKNVMSKEIVQRMVKQGVEAWRGNGRTSREGTQVQLSQTAWEGTQVPLKYTDREGILVPLRRSHFNEAEFQEHEEDFFNILDGRTSALV